MNLVRQYLRDTLWVALGYLVLMTGALAAAVFYWPDFRDNMPAIFKLIPFDALRDLIAGIDEFGYWAYFAIQQYFKGCSLFGLAAAALFGSGLVAREADQKTAEFLLSRPVSRRRVLLTRFAVAAVLVVAPVFLSSLAGMAMSPLIGEHLALTPVLLGACYLSLFLLMQLAFCTWLSAGFEHQLKAGIILIGLMLLQFALYLVKGLGDYTLFALVDVNRLAGMTTGQFPWPEAASFAGAGLLFLLLALRRFERRDF
ncbi:MAG: ABC transporter permease [Planctomycetes bacterium]|nr:ABC transporter permease [Planctomycetota bacterium]MBL7008442.1 ABC transporter permease [Planctomycetota bacterium]